MARSDCTALALTGSMPVSWGLAAPPAWLICATAFTPLLWIASASRRKPGISSSRAMEKLAAVGLALLAHKGVLGNHQAQVPALGFFLIVFHQAIADGPIWVGLSRGHGWHDQPVGQIHPADCNRLC